MCKDRFGQELKVDDKITFVIPGNSTMQSGTVNKVFKNSVEVWYIKGFGCDGMLVSYETNVYRRSSKNIIKEPVACE
jgi:hypothetical protein